MDKSPRSEYRCILTGSMHLSSQQPRPLPLHLSNICEFGLLGLLSSLTVLERVAVQTPVVRA